MVYMEVKIQDISTFSEDVLMLVIPDSNYDQQVPIKLGTLHIDKALHLEEEGTCLT